MSTVASTPTVESKSQTSNSFWADALRRLKKNKAAVISAFFVIAVCLVALFARLIAPFSFDEQDMNAVLQAPGGKYLLGTDSLGRDMLSRIIFGARMSMAVGIGTSVMSLVIGTLYGACAGWWGGRVDAVMMRLVDIIVALPELVLLIIMTMLFNAINPIQDPELKALVGIFLALSVVGWVGVARLVRGQVLQVKEMLYVEAARALGASPLAIIWRHILPNIMGPIVVTLTFQIPANVLYESFLSFIGLGLQPPFSSWGVLANEGWRSLRTYPHLIIFPGVALFFTMLAFNLFGDGLRDAIDPKMK